MDDSNLEIDEGEELSFKCSAVNRDGLTSTANVMRDEVVSKIKIGEMTGDASTHFTYSFGAVSLGDEGDYSCAVTYTYQDKTEQVYTSNIIVAVKGLIYHNMLQTLIVKVIKI